MYDLGSFLAGFFTALALVGIGVLTYITAPLENHRYMDLPCKSCRMKGRCISSLGYCPVRPSLGKARTMSKVWRWCWSCKREWPREHFRNSPDGRCLDCRVTPPSGNTET